MMTDTTTDAAASTAPAISPEIQAQLDSITEIKAENQRLTAKIEEANKHNKAAETESKRLAREKAEAEGNFKQLFESSEAERTQLQSQLQGMADQTANEKRNTAALRLAVDLAGSESNAGILADCVAKRLKFVDNMLKVVDESGNLTVSTIDDLKKEFANSARFSSLLKGNQSSGGGAAGGSNGSGAAPSITRSEFDSLDANARMKFVKSGGKLND